MAALRNDLEFYFDAFCEQEWAAVDESTMVGNKEWN